MSEIPTHFDANNPRRPRGLPREFSRYHQVELFNSSGGEGIVYVGRDVKGEFGKVAIKIPKEPTPEAIERFVKESCAAALMKHRNVVGALDNGEVDQQTPYVVTAFFSGGTLAKLLEEQPKRDWQEAVSIARQVADAAQYVCEHRELVHCDIKPHNILLDEERTPHLTDFGIANWNPGEPLDDVRGTPLYMSPEQISGGTVDSRSDVWSIGVVLYQMLTGRLPFKGERALSRIATEPPMAPRQIDQKIPPAVESLVLKCLNKKIEDRFSSPIDLAEELGRIEQQLREKKSP